MKTWCHLGLRFESCLEYRVYLILCFKGL
uniref:Uncharacterized protein n=1 Tax=Anguilla anguilla TaxID=7936 RepID=A0A0E9UQQ0_ANGAN